MSLDKHLKMKYVKSAPWMRLADNHLKAILLVGCCNSNENMYDIFRISVHWV